MDALHTSMAELSTLCCSSLEQFRQELEQASGSPTTTSVAAQFSVFRTLVLTTLQNLQKQVDLLARQQDHIETRGRRKMLLIHGVAETKDEDPVAVMTSTVKDRLKLPEFSAADIKRCHRLKGRATDKARPLVVKLVSHAIRDKIWYAKTAFKGSGIIVSEFLTKTRHDVFMSARKRFGVNRAWTKDGTVFVLSSNGERYSAVSITDLDAIPFVAPDSAPVSQKVRTGSRSAKPVAAPSATASARSRRPAATKVVK